MGRVYSLLLSLVLFLSVCGCSGCSGDVRDTPRYASRHDFIRFNRHLFWCDSVCITRYSDSLLLNPVPTPTYLWLTVHSEGVGKPLSNGDRVTLAYTVSTLLGDTLYSSDTDGLRSLVIGRAEFTIGVDEALRLLRRGSEATVILIPDKAYGLRGDDKKIRGRVILRFDIAVDPQIPLSE